MLPTTPCFWRTSAVRRPIGPAPITSAGLARRRPRRASAACTATASGSMSTRWSAGTPSGNRDQVRSGPRPGRSARPGTRRRRTASARRGTRARARSGSSRRSRRAGSIDDRRAGRDRPAVALHHAVELVAQDQRRLEDRVQARVHLEVGAADPALGDADDALRAVLHERTLVERRTAPAREQREATDPCFGRRRSCLPVASFMRRTPSRRSCRRGRSSSCGRTRRAAGRCARTCARRSSRAGPAAGSRAAARCG